MADNESKSDPADPIVIGADDIKVAMEIEGLKVKKRQVYFMLENGVMPGFKIGRLWATTPGMIREHLANLKTSALNRAA